MNRYECPSSSSLVGTHGATVKQHPVAKWDSHNGPPVAPTKTVTVRYCRFVPNGTDKHVKSTAFNANKTGPEQGMMSVANAISVSFLVTLVLPLLAYTQTADAFYLYLPTGILITNIAVDGTKRVLGSSGVFGRPAAAAGCDLFCIGGPVGRQPGFPSGHVTTATMFVAAMWLHTRALWVLIIGVPWVAAMAWARWYKHCHNIPQIVGGVVAGCIGAALMMSIVSRPDHEHGEQRLYD